MKNNVNSKNQGAMIKAVLFGVIAGYIALFFVLIVSSFILLSFQLENNALNIISTAVLAVSGVVCGFVSAKKAGIKILITGLFAGILYYLSVAVVSLLVAGGGISSLFIIRLILTTTMSGLGAFLSVANNKSKSII